MSVAQEIPSKAETPAPIPPPRRNGRWAGYSHLLMARMLELKREPEVVFWVFVFPLLLALGLGIAFRNKPGDAVSVAIVAGNGSEVAQSLLARSPQHDLFKIQMLDAAGAHKGFRLTDKDILSGSGSFRLDAGATLVIGNSKGINTAVGCSGSNGGGNLLSRGANYVYHGTVAQMAGTKLPSTVNNLTIDNSAGVTLEDPDTVTGTLYLEKGKFTLGDHNLTVTNIVGASSSNYIYTDKKGTVNVQKVGSTDVVIPVGTAASYLPVVLNNTGTVDDFSFHVKNTFDYPPSSSAVVNAQWTISERGTGAKATVTLQWNKSDEGATFVHDNPLFVARYAGSSWGESPAKFNDPGDGTYTASAEGFTAFTVFGVSNSGALPVQIAAFRATAMGAEGVRLEWKTSSEINNYGFVVQRSSQPASGFGSVSGLIPGHGTTLVPHEYSFTDTSHSVATCYYRLQQVDLDNSVYYSEALLVNSVTSVDNQSAMSFGLQQNYPNPFNPTTTIQIVVGGVVAPSGAEGPTTVIRGQWSGDS